MRHDLVSNLIVSPLSLKLVSVDLTRRLTSKLTSRSILKSTLKSSGQDDLVVNAVEKWNRSNGSTVNFRVDFRVGFLIRSQLQSRLPSYLDLPSESSRFKLASVKLIGQIVPASTRVNLLVNFKDSYQDVFQVDFPALDDLAVNLQALTRTLKRDNRLGAFQETPPKSTWQSTSKCPTQQPNNPASNKQTTIKTIIKTTKLNQTKKSKWNVSGDKINNPV